MHPENLKALTADNLYREVTKPEIVSGNLARVSHLESSYARMKFSMEPNQVAKFAILLCSRSRARIKRKRIAPETLSLIVGAAILSAYAGLRMNNTLLRQYTQLAPGTVRKWRFVYNMNLDYLDNLEDSMLWGISGE